MSVPELWWSETYGVISRAGSGYETLDLDGATKSWFPDLPDDAVRIVVQRDSTPSRGTRP